MNTSRPPDPPPVPIRMRIDFGAASHAGKVRSNNEDRYLVARLAKSMHICRTNMGNEGETRFSGEDGHLLVVADGMGGAKAGERASSLAVRRVEDYTLDTLKWFFHLGGAGESVLLGELRQSLELADRAVVGEGMADARFAGMGTTLTMAYSVGADLYVVHAGDSRAYLWHRGELNQITNDHTLVQLLISGGALKPEEARFHAKRNVVTNVIGGPQVGVTVEIHKLRLEAGDLLVLCSDGLTEPVPDDELTAIVAEAAPAQAITDRLVQRALDRGGPDNVTVVVARFEGDDNGGATAESAVMRV